MLWSEDSALVANVEASASGVLSIAKPEQLPEQRSFNVTCHDVHEQVNAFESYRGSHLSIVIAPLPHLQTLEVRVSNTATPSNPLPVTASGSAVVKCFPPLHLTPRAVRVAIGVTKKVQLREGHALASQVKFTVDDDSVASVDADGNIIGLNLGHTVLRANAANSLFDSVDVFVEFTGFKIVSPLDTVQLSQPLTLQLQGVDGELPDHPSFLKVSPHKIVFCPCFTSLLLKNPSPI